MIMFFKITWNDIKHKSKPVLFSIFISKFMLVWFLSNLIIHELNKSSLNGVFEYFMDLDFYEHICVCVVLMTWLHLLLTLFSIAKSENNTVVWKTNHIINHKTKAIKKSFIAYFLKNSVWYILSYDFYSWINFTVV